jgi:hypothetical protein
MTKTAAVVSNVKKWKLLAKRVPWRECLFLADLDLVVVVQVDLGMKNAVQK